MAECVECFDEYPDARLHMHDLGTARYYCARCAGRRVSMRDVQLEMSKHLVLEHKIGYRLVRSREDVRAISTGKPTGGTTTESR